MNRKPIRIAPSKIVYAGEGNNPPWRDIIISRVKYLQEWLRALVIVTLLMVIPVAIGIYAYRIATLQPLTFERAMIAVFRSTSPGSNVIWLTFLSGFIILVLNLKNVLGHESKETISNATRFFAGIVLIIWLDFYWLIISPFRLWTGKEIIAIDNNIEIFTAQAVTVILTLLILPLGAKIVHVRKWQLNIRMNQIFISTFNWLRFSLAIGLIVVFIDNIMSIGVPENLLSNVPANAFPRPWIDLRTLDVTILLVVLGVGSIFYRAPEIRKMRTFGIVRALIFLSTFLACGWIFQQLPNINGFVVIVSVAGAFAISAIPIQRWLS